MSHDDSHDDVSECVFLDITHTRDMACPLSEKRCSSRSLDRVLYHLADQWVQANLLGRLMQLKSTVNSRRAPNINPRCPLRQSPLSGRALHHARHGSIEVVLTVSLGLVLAQAGNLSFGNPINAAGNAPSEAVLQSAVEPEDRAERSLVAPIEIDG
ncbi:hypothetical protein BKA56DRAFT_662718 [Ilyonectria sp. MPI-CAGE-AT-0026]|nr:hypothetical protein BKA56DRAFT_662718 [Ilyonectria sp. MPI-CAGE-AT-0026]